MKKITKALSKVWNWMFDKASYAIATLLLISFVLAPTALVIWLLQIILKLLGVM